MEQRYPVAGSEAIHSEGGNWLPADANQQISPTIIIRRPKRAQDVGEQLLSGSYRQVSREEAEQMMRVDPSDLAEVQSFVEGYGLKIIAENAEARTVQVEGSVMRLSQAFGVKIEWRTDPEGRKYLSYQGPLTVPAALAGVIEAVLGVDQRPIARRGVGR